MRLCVNQGRIVATVDDVVGDLVLLANPDMSLMAQEVCAAVIRGLNRFFMTVDDASGRIRLANSLLLSVRSLLEMHRAFLVISLTSLMIVKKPRVVMTL